MVQAIRFAVKSNIKRYMRFFLNAYLCLGLLAGCADVRPWERGVLAKPHMAMKQEPLPSLMREHNYSSREAGSSTSIGGGGGCGCY